MPLHALRRPVSLAGKRATTSGVRFQKEAVKAVHALRRAKSGSDCRSPEALPTEPASDWLSRRRWAVGIEGGGGCCMPTRAATARAGVGPAQVPQRLRPGRAVALHRCAAVQEAGRPGRVRELGPHGDHA
jgi:hypothetical protein